ncbi:ferritin heavy chain, partial [Schistosoma bovis]
SLLELHEVASRNNDPGLTDFIESEFLHEQEDAIKQFADYLTETQRVGKGLGEYLFDKLTLNE